MAYQAQIKIKTTGLQQLNKVNAAVDRINKSIIQINRGSSRVKTNDIVKISKQNLAVKKDILKVETETTKQIAQQNKLRRGSARGGGRAGGGVSGGGGGGGSGVLSSAVISGAFPLLFGQGPLVGAAGALGGGLGAAFGGQMGGFAGGLAATAAVTAIQNTINGVADLGKSLQTLDGTFKVLTERSLFSSKEAQRRAEILQILGKREELATLVSEELTNAIGVEGVERLKRAAESSEELAKSLGELGTSLQILLAGPVANFLNAINNFIKENTKVGDTSLTIGQNRDGTKATTGLTPGESKFIESNRKVLESFSDGQLEILSRIPLDQKTRDLQAAQGMSNVSELERSAIRKFVLGRQAQPGQSAISGKPGEGGTSGNLFEGEVNTKLIGERQKRIELLKKETTFFQNIIDKGKEKALLDQEINNIKENLTEKELKMLELGDMTIQQIVEQRNETKKLAENALLVDEAFKQMSTTIGNDIKNGIAGLIKGTSTLGDLLNNVADRFLDVALNQALFGDILGAGGKKGGGILGFLGFANGGRPPVGKPSIVGERGPELFVPRSSGTIVPNNKLGGGGSTSVVVNVDASGSDVQGDDSGAKELGALISVAVQGELVKQQRPGGLLSSIR